MAPSSTAIWRTLWNRRGSLFLFAPTTTTTGRARGGLAYTAAVRLPFLSSWRSFSHQPPTTPITPNGPKWSRGQHFNSPQTKTGSFPLSRIASFLPSRTPISNKSPPSSFSLLSSSLQSLLLSLPLFSSASCEGSPPDEGGKCVDCVSVGCGGGCSSCQPSPSVAPALRPTTPSRCPSHVPPPSTPPPQPPKPQPPPPNPPPPPSCNSSPPTQTPPPPPPQAQAPPKQKASCTLESLLPHTQHNCGNCGSSLNQGKVNDSGGGGGSYPSMAPPQVQAAAPPPNPNPSSKKGGKVPINWCEDGELSHSVLVRQACQLTVDSVTRILCETISAYQDYHEKYRCLLDALIEALEFSRTAHGTQLELLDCKIIIGRAEVDNMRNKIIELEAFLCSVQRLAEATAETAFLGHAEYYSVAMSERVQSAYREMKMIKEESAKKERDMIELQSVVIVESGRGLK